MKEAFLLYGFWQIAISIFAIGGLIVFWRSLRKYEIKDQGWFFFIISILLWGLVGIAYLILYIQLDDSGSNIKEIKNAFFLGHNFDLYISLLSISNSYALLLALPWFRHIPKFCTIYLGLKSKVQYRSEAKKPEKTYSFEIQTGILWLIATGVSLRLPQFSSWADSLFGSAITIPLLTYVLYHTFKERRPPAYEGLAYLSLFALSVTFAAQVFKLFGTESEIWMIALSASFKSMLILLFFSLAMTWTDELLDEKGKLPSSKDIFFFLISRISLSSDGQLQTKDAAIITIPGLIQNELIDYDAKTFHQLSRLIETEGSFVLNKEKDSTTSNDSDIQDTTTENGDKPDTVNKNTGSNTQAVPNRLDTQSNTIENESNFEIEIEEIINPILKKIKSNEPDDTLYARLKDRLFEEIKPGNFQLKVPLENIENIHYLNDLPTLDRELSPRQIHLDLLAIKSITAPNTIREANFYAYITIPGYAINRFITFPSKRFTLLIKAYDRQISGKYDGFLIQGEDFGQQNELRRIVETIAEELYGKDTEATKAAIKALWPKFFKTKKGRYKLVIPKENIRIIPPKEDIKDIVERLGDLSGGV